MSKKAAAPEFVLTLKDEIKKTQVEMETAYSNFSCSTVPELIDSSIYDVKSIWDRYQYLLRQLKSIQDLPYLMK